MGGSLPGDTLLEQQGETPAQIATHPHPFYTPIATFGQEYVLEPVARGLQFAGSLSGSRLFRLDFTSRLQSTGVNATAYAGESAGHQRSVVILNKDLGKDLEVMLDFGKGSGRTVEVATLQAPAIDSRAARIVRAAKGRLSDDGRHSVSIARASGMRVTVAQG